ncbi:MAG: outer membrane protein assembly factor BamA [Pseudomonadota bacterium]
MSVMNLRIENVGRMHLTQALRQYGRNGAACIALLVLCALWQPAMAAEPFEVRNMRVEGLERISEGTVFNYLPINIGDVIDEVRVREALRTLYSQGLFDDVALRRDGNTLVVVVKERPQIEQFTIDGNKDIKTEDLEESLRSVGLARGKTFDRSVLDEVTQFLIEQYYSRGKYGVSVEARVEDRPNNAVAVFIDVVEGDRARIRQINIVGNSAFDDDELVDAFELKLPNFLSFIRQDDRYSREALTGDLETLSSYYLDRGYADFQVTSTQVAISPDRENVYITVNVSEGEVYTLSDVKIAGKMVVPEAYLRPLVLAKPGDTFSQRNLTQSTEYITLRLGANGYADAKVDFIPQLNRDDKTVDVTIYVEPNNRIYVRNINFNGIDQVNDEVLRREVRQMEGAYLSNQLLDRSKIRLQQLPYLETVDFSTTPVPGSNDQVDVNFDIDYGLPGQFGGGLGYSETQRLLLNGNFTHTNFMGTGNRVSAEVNSSRFQTVYSISHTNPYVTRDGIRRTASVSFRNIDQFNDASSDLSTETITAALEYAYPITEYQNISLGGAWQSARLIATEGGSPQQVIDWITQNGNGRVNENVDFFGQDLTVFSSEFDTFELVGGWSFDSRNRALFATRGQRHRVSFAMAVPGSDVEYWTARYDGLNLIPLWGQWGLQISNTFAFGEGLGDTTAVPPYKLFRTGGPGSVRGFREFDLGPRDSQGRPYGGNLLLTSQIELTLPMPDRFRGRGRAALFYDIGNVFSTGEIAFTDRLGADLIDFDFDENNLKQSVGVAVEWLAPLGLFRFSYAYPLNNFDGNSRLFGDRVERFQFTIGNAF